MCDRDIYPTIGLSALNVGGPIGVYTFGIINDRLGRRIAYFSCLATLITGSIITAASVNFWMWCSSRVIVGLTVPAVYQIPFIIGEYQLLLSKIMFFFLTKSTLISSFGISWTRISIICYRDDVHFLHIRHHDVGRSDLYSSKLGRNVTVHICPIFIIFFLLIHYAGESALASGSGKIRRCSEDIGSYGQS